MTIEEAVQNVMCGKCIPHKKETKDKINNILQENEQLKALLKLAVDVINDIECQSCNYCSDCVGSPDSCSDMEGFVWKHADEAMKLIGGNEND